MGGLSKRGPGRPGTAGLASAPWAFAAGVTALPGAFRVAFCSGPRGPLAGTALWGEKSLALAVAATGGLP